ncbi:hypothetical protein [Dielma fastidiosa]|uniref:hypothetical protein n=1 Tax=Dielma fastidiosa TaxID=1034346 RepID=UPI0023F5913F|nr:hypothetical protein [Dielma fastidiosa]
MENKYKILWTDMHSNIHHEGMSELPKWYAHAKSMLDFWPIAYYPYYMRKLPSGMGVEDIHDLDKVKADWEELRSFVNKANAEGWPMFMGYEWQGSGLDGDHNVFFKNNENEIAFPLRYQELYELYKDKDAIAIPHHLAYQSGSRGKNWDTHIEAFSPFAEVYSSHGSSENDYGSIPMNRHVHMGPRVGANSVESGYKRGYHFGLIASGDNHSVPAVSEFGSMAILAENRTKDAIWEAMQKRHVYGVSNERIKLRMDLDGAMMGDCTSFKEASELNLNIEGSNALDRIEVIVDNDVADIINCNHRSSKPEGKVHFKFKLEFGWGPDRRVFPDIASRKWHGCLHTEGSILSVENAWNTMGQAILHQDENDFEFELTTYKTTQTGKWMGSAAITTEGFIFEIETAADEVLKLNVDGIDYELPVQSLLNDSMLFSLDDEAKRLIYDTYQEESFYRNDTWWHNTYKFKANKAAVKADFMYQGTTVLDLSAAHHVRIRVHQKNGCMAWSSPIFNKES